MEIARYIKIKAIMPDSLRMKLDHIKRYLDEGKAAALVGAGFSKNARMPEAAGMKDWNALGIEFYKRLYGEPKTGDLLFQNPISLATQVEASFGRHELDNMERSIATCLFYVARFQAMNWCGYITMRYIRTSTSLSGLSRNILC